MAWSKDLGKYAKVAADRAEAERLLTQAERQATETVRQQTLAVKESNKTKWLPAVATLALRDSTYPNPQNGDTVRVTGISTTYRFETGTGWVKTDEYNPTAIDNITSQLAETAKQSDLISTNSTVALKSDKAYVDTKIASVVSGSPKGTYATVTALQTAFPTGNTNTYVVTSDGKWYYWNGSVWTSGGVYQSTGISNKAIEPKHISFLEVPKNLFIGDYVQGFLSGVNGSYRSDPAGGSVAVVEIEPNKTYSIKLHDVTTVKRFILSILNTLPVFTGAYKPVDRFIVYDNLLNQYTFTNDANGKYLLAYVSGNFDKPKLQIEEGSIYTTYDSGFHQLPVAYNRELKVAVDDLSTVKANKTTLNTGKLIHPHGAVNFNTVTGKITFGEGIELIYFKNYTAIPTKITIPTHEITVITSAYFLNRYILFYRPSLNKVHYTRPEVFAMTEEDIYLGSLRYGGTNDKLEITGFENYYVNGKPVISDEKNATDFLLLDNLYGIYNRPNGLVSMATGTPTPLQGSSHTIIYSIYDNLVNNFPEYVTKTLLGNDSSGLPIYKYDFNPEIPENQTSFDFKKIKILVTSAVHGYEQLSAWSTAKFFEDLCNNIDEKEVLEFIRWNVHFSVIPVCNPWGYDANTRFNFNSIDLNRNFPQGWTYSDLQSTYPSGESAGSEVETQIIMQFLQDNTDAVYHIDHHNIGAGYPLVYSGSQPETQISMNVFRTLTRKWRKDYVEAPTTGSFGYIKSTSGNGTMTAYSRTLMDATTLESAWMMPFTTVKYDKITVESAVDLFGNFNVAILKSLI